MFARIWLWLALALGLDDGVIYSDPGVNLGYGSINPTPVKWSDSLRELLDDGKI